MNMSKFWNLDSAFDKVAVFGFFRQLSVLGVEEQLVREPGPCLSVHVHNGKCPIDDSSGSESQLGKTVELDALYRGMQAFMRVLFHHGQGPRPCLPHDCLFLYKESLLHHLLFTRTH